jgi:ketosteroid isomerase-like protein
MNTKETLEAYFSGLEQKKEWHSFLADDMTFTSFTSPLKRLRGRAVYLESTRRFFAMITTVTLKELIVDGERACALTHYELQPPGGSAFGSDVAEVFRVKAGKITSLDIYFDTAPYPK